MMYNILYEFLPRDALYCKARYCDCMMNVRLSLTLVDHMLLWSLEGL